MSALILVGMSVGDVDHRDLLQAHAKNRGATIAFLQMGDPSLSAELTRVADSGAQSITLVGVDTGALAPGHSWLLRIAGHWWRERAGHRPQVLVATRLVKRLGPEPDPSAGDGDTPRAGDLDEVLAQTRVVTGTEAGLRSAAWEQVSGHRHQVMVCRGPRCTAAGQVENLRSLLLMLTQRGLGDDDVLVTSTGCQFPCNQAPVISIQPDDIWYGRVDLAATAQIVSEHVVGGRPVASHRLPRK